MPERIANRDYYAVKEIAERLDVSRQTLWRWRQAGRIPPGARFRDGRVLFSKEELALIEHYANRLETISAEEPHQPRLFEDPRSAPADSANVREEP